jgi:restriction system protein
MAAGTARQLHQADVVVLVINAVSPASVRPSPEGQRLHLVDRDALARWGTGSPDMGSASPTPARPQAPSTVLRTRPPARAPGAAAVG